MYRMLVFGLSGNALIAILASSFGVLSLSATGLITSFLVAIVAAFTSNYFISKYWGVVSSSESWYITALILFFILPPATTIEKALYIALAVVVAIASKYLITIHKKHVFNPAAFGAFVLGITGIAHSSWWIGSDVLWPFILAFGLFAIRKIRKFQLLLTFVVTSLLTSILVGLTSDISVVKTLDFAITSSPLIFLGTIMLSEPATMPSRRHHQLLFGALVGILYAWHPTIGPVFIYPETALLIGNVYAFIVSSKQRYIMTLKHVEKISPQVSNFVFTSSSPVKFLPGQYAEWTLGHTKVDMRGNRRSFTIASSPTEKDVHLGVKFYNPSSSFKQKLQTLKAGDKLYLDNITGDFTLPTNPKEKTIMIAGGIGITPFRSMLQYIVDTKQRRNVVLYYIVSSPEEVAYSYVFHDAKALGVKTVLIHQDSKVTTFDAETIKAYTPDYKNRTIYISGPHAMVESYVSLLKDMGMSRRSIKTDHFSGY